MGFLDRFFSESNLPKQIVLYVSMSINVVIIKKFGGNLQFLDQFSHVHEYYLDFQYFEKLLKYQLVSVDLSKMFAI